MTARLVGCIRRSHLLSAYELAVAAGGLTLWLWSLTRFSFSNLDPVLVAVLSLAGAVLLQVRVTLSSGVSFAPALPLIVAVLFKHGLPLTALVIAPGTIIRVLRAGHPSLAAFFAAGQMILSAASARAIASLVAAGLGPVAYARFDILVWLLAIVVLDTVNVSLVSVRLALQQGRPFTELFLQIGYRDRRALLIPYNVLILPGIWLYNDRGLFGLFLCLLLVLGFHRLLVMQREFAQNVETGMRDSLTGCYNRRFLETWFRQHARRSGACGLLFVDLDQFKTVNDCHGHDVGDAVLQRLSAVLRDSIREDDLLIRYAGDEFVVACPGAGKAETIAVAERLLSAVRSQAAVEDGTAVPCTVNVGVASSPDDAPLGWSLLGLADQAMYEAKKSGRDAICVSDQQVGSSLSAARSS
ncbi:MAG: GGDEF domain-containing protein [bacterium]|nr:GGDEF domain-containing protein [bacterium]